MRVPIVRNMEGRYFAILNFNLTPPGFEDCFEDSLFYRRFQQSQALGEFGPPDLTALTGNPNAMSARLVSLEPSRVCFNLLLGNSDHHCIQLEIHPYGPFSDQLRTILNRDIQGYLKFRTMRTEIDEQMVVTKILGADFTTTP